MNQTSILIIDDDQLDRYLLTRDLQRGGTDAHIFECCDGVEALEFLEGFEANRATHGDQFPPQIILLDINMPRVSGFGFLDAFADLKNRYPDYARCSIMMVSSSEHPNERERALANELVVDFVVKGRTSAEELSSKIGRALA